MELTRILKIMSTRLISGLVSIALLATGAGGQPGEPEPICEYQHMFRITKMCFTQKGKFISFGDDYGGIFLLSVQTGQVVSQYSPSRYPEEAIYGLVLSPDGRLIAYVNAKGVIRVKELSSGRLLFKTRGAAAIFAPNSLTFATMDTNAVTNRIWDSRHFGQLSTFRTDKGSGGFAFTPNSKALVRSNREGQVVLSEIPKKKENSRNSKIIFSLQEYGIKDEFGNVAFSRNGRYMAFYGWVNAGIYDLADRRFHFLGKRDHELISWMEFTPDGGLLITSGSGLDIRNYPLASKKLKADKEISRPFNVKFWEVPTGRLVKELENYEGFTISPDGDMIALLKRGANYREKRKRIEIFKLHDFPKLK